MEMHFRHIWIIDDNEIDTFILESFLTKWVFDMKIRHAGHGREAINWLENESAAYPDLIFLDINMPIMDGFTFLKEWTALGHTGNCKIVMISSSIFCADKQRALKFRDVVEFVEKPLSEKKLRALFQSILEPELVRV